MRLCARGPSGTLTAATPAALSARHCSSMGVGSTPFGGTISTLVTNSPHASLRPQSQRSAPAPRRGGGGGGPGRRPRGRGAGGGGAHGGGGAGHQGGDVLLLFFVALGRHPHPPAARGGARLDHAPRVARHVLGRGEVDL